MKLFKGSVDTNIYVVNEKYRIIYCNDVLKSTYPDFHIGDTCYKSLCGEKKPCDDCPLKKREGGKGILYNKYRSRWLELDSGIIEWPGEGNCNIVFFKAIHEGNKSLRYNLADRSDYEELPELDLSKKQFDSNDKSKDELTGLYKRNVFFLTADNYLKGAASGEYCLMAIDIEHFKLFNEWYGQEDGDRFLINVGHHLKQAEIENSGIAGYMGSDDFCIILPYDVDVLTQLQDQILGYVKQYGGNAGFLPAFGMYRIEDMSVPLNLIYDRACIAISSVKGNYSRRVCWYDEQMMQKMEEAHTLLVEVQRALEREEFTFYAQPKCNLITGKIVGLESLVRWIHPERGVISPGEFIPILEQNGFITELDLYIWESVCIHLREWIDSGHRCIPISVNVSRVDIYTLDVVEVFCDLITKYRLDQELLEIEITESAYVEEYQIISEVIEKLRSRGFTVLMDDFGSGYSSLNMLKDVNVDVLKIDMKFLELDRNVIGKGRGILEAIVCMAQLMELRLIAEGVETKEQKNLLVDMGCLYAQGFYFYRPLPLEPLGVLLADESVIDFRGMRARQIDRINVKELLNGGLLSEESFMRLAEDNRKAAAAIFAQMAPGGMVGGYCAEGMPLYFANYEMVKLLGYESYDDMALGIEGKVVCAEDGRPAIISVCSDISETMLVQNELSENNRKLTRRNQELYFMNNDMPGGYHRRTLEEGFELLYISNRFQDIFGYTQEEIKQLFNNRFLNMVHPDDRLKVIKDVEHIKKDRHFNMEYRMQAKRGYIWVIEQSKYLEYEGKGFIQGVVLDVTSVKKNEQEFWLLSQKMESILRQAGVNSWEWDIENHVLLMTSVKPSERMEKVYKKLENDGTYVTDFPECVARFRSIPEEYRQKFSEYLSSFQCGEVARSSRVEVPVIVDGGEMIWLQIACETIRDDNGVPVKAVGYYMDITEQKNEYLKSKESIRALEIDSLTGLYNRQTAVPQIKEYLDKLEEDETAALIMFDLDNFKLANDVFGHIYGDTIIARNAQKLRDFFRDEDIVCRMGGDEFLVLCKCIGQECIERKLDSIIKDMVITYPYKEKDIIFSLSAGFAMVPEMGKTFDELYERADIALFSAKMSGKSSYRKYDSVMKTVRYELAEKCNVQDDALKND